MMRILMLISFLVFSILSYSQDQDLFKLYLPEKNLGNIPLELASDVHSFDEFIGKYNGKLNGYGKKLLKKDVDKILVSKEKRQDFRYGIIGSLVIDSLQTAYPKKVTKFAIRASEGPILDFKSSNWYVLIPFYGNWKNQRVEGRMKVKIHYIDKNKCRWIIDEVTFNKFALSKNLNTVEPEVCNSIYIPPSAHDNGFISLQKLFSYNGELKNHILKSSESKTALDFLIKNDFRPIFSDYYYFIKVSNKLNFVLNNDYRIIQIND